MFRRTIARIFVVGFSCAAAAADFDAPSNATLPSISVSGSATVFVTPDKVQVQFGVEVFDAKLDAARAAHDERVRKILAAVKDVGVEAKDVRTTHASVAPEYDRDQHGMIRYDQRRGFRVTKSIGVTLRDASKLDALVNRAFDAGATTLNSIGFESTELKKHRDDARRQSAKAAREKAELIAAELGSKVGRAIRINEELPPDFNPYAQMASNRMSFDAAGGPAGSEGEPTFALGQIEVKVVVHATFELTQ